MVHFMNSKVVGKQSKERFCLESKAKKDFVLINQRRTRMRYDTSLRHISVGSMGLKIADPLSSLLHVIQCRSGATLFNFIHLYSTTF